MYNSHVTEAQLLRIVEDTLSMVLPRASDRPVSLSKAVRYAVGTGGKRIRPLVCLGSALAVGGKAQDAAFPAAAIELLHNYTLIHDDLPSMDNDTMRRGHPSVWFKYGEAEAILAGDALQSLAFVTASRSPRNAETIVYTLGKYGVGVVFGQVEDLMRQQSQEHKGDIDFIYEHKTADLFIAASLMGGLAAGADMDEIKTLKKFAYCLGIAFQYEDDLLDDETPCDKDECKKVILHMTANALAALDNLPGDTTILHKLTERLVDRKE